MDLLAIMMMMKIMTVIMMMTMAMTMTMTMTIIMKVSTIFIKSLESRKKKKNIFRKLMENEI